MLANATLTLNPFFNTVKDVDKCNFDLETTFLNKVADVGICHFDLEATFFFLEKKPTMLTNATLTLKPFFKPGQGCWQMPL